MPLSDKDRELWQVVTRDVKPLFTNQYVDIHTSSVKITNSSPHSQPVWDLHGMTLDQAHQLTLHQVHEHHKTWKSMTFITGKSGQMNHEFQHWLGHNPLISRVENVNGGGAYRVWFRKIRNKRP